MKRILLIISIALLLLIVNAIPTFGNSITVGQVLGSFGSGTIDTVMTGSSIKFFLRYENTAGLPLSIVNGFEIYSPNGATWSGPLIIDTTSGPGAPLTKSSGNFDLAFAASVFDGASRDTFAIGGVRLTGQGLPPGYNNMPYGLGIGSFDYAEDGLTVCIDSAFYRPVGEWRWSHPSLGNFAPSWGGPYCFTIFTCCTLPPTITNAPIDITGSHCETLAYDFNATDWEMDPIRYELVSGPGTIDSWSGVWVWDDATPDDAGADVTIEVRACDTWSCGTPVTVPIIVTNGPPMIDGCGGTPGMVGEGDVVSARLEAYDECLGVSVLWSASILAGNGGSDQASVSPGGSLTFAAGFDGGPRTVDVAAIASDGALADTCFFQFQIVEGAFYEVRIGEALNAPRGQVVEVPVTLNSAGPEGIGGYSFTITYDYSALMPNGITLGEPFGPSGCDWEYFTYRFLPNDQCTQWNCGLLGITGIANTNNGPDYPTCRVPSVLPAEIFWMEFVVSTDPTVGCHTYPIRFFWEDCRDNIIGSDDGNVQFISDSVFDYQPSPTSINATEGIEFPTYFGAQEECLIDPDGTGPKYPPLRGVDFRNGRIDVLCADSNDCRGDINLNGIPYEVADVVKMLTYFTYGCGDFPPPECQLMFQCSDVNGDGMGMTVSDIVFLIRVIIGDTKPLPRKAADNIHLERQGDIMATESELGAALVIIAGETAPTLLAEGMQMKSHFDGHNTRVMIFPPFGDDVTHLATFHGPFLEVEGRVVSVDVALPDGRGVPRVMFEDLPSEFALEQNYPNPFNPGTIIAFSLPAAGDVKLEIYNMLGQEVVTLLDGMTQAGQHRIEWDGRDRLGTEVPSGVYLYRLSTGVRVETKKMILIR